MIAVTPFTIRDYLEALAAVRLAQGYDPLGGLDWQETAHDLYHGGPGYAARLNGVLLGCAGVTGITPGWPKGEAWAIVTPTGVRHPLIVTRAVYRGLAKIILENRVRRVEAHVAVGDARALRWAKALGFKNEGVAWSWGPQGDDYFSMAWVSRRESRVDPGVTTELEEANS
jgi:hypothetical protein